MASLDVDSLEVGTHCVGADYDSHCSVVVDVSVGELEVASSVVNDFALLGFRVLGLVMSSGDS